jgi:filamentous hemagglutinin
MRLVIRLRKEIKNLDDFNKLTDKQQKQVMNNKENYQPLVKSYNCSKGCKVQGTDKEWKTYKKKPLNKDYLEQLEAKQEEMRKRLEKQIEDMVNKT